MQAKIDPSYKIKEYLINPDWDKDFPPEYYEYRRKWDLTNNYFLHDIPLFLEVESTYACNYRCNMCLRYESDQFSSKGHMPNDILDKLFGEIKKCGIPSMAFSHGGEPLMRKDLPDLLLMAKAVGMVDRMFHTNGFLMTSEKAEKLIANGLTKINFSIDAVSGDTYDKIRVGGNYEKVVRNVFNFIEVRKRLGLRHPRIRVSFVVQPDNAHEVDAFYKFWEPHVDMIAFQELNEYKPATKAQRSKMEACTQLWQLLTVSHTGDVLLCEFDYSHECVIGNLRTNTLLECWNSEKMQEARYHHLRGEHHKVPLCKKCPKRS